MHWRLRWFHVLLAAFVVISGILANDDEAAGVMTEASSTTVSSSTEESSEAKGEECDNPDKINLITLEELEKYNGKVKGEKIYLSVLGQAYDVTKGHDYYSDGAGYHIFAGRDGAVPFVTGKFTEEEANKSTDELTDTQVFQLKHWQDFYRDEAKYPFIGRVVGRYYDSEGNPTEELNRVQKRIDDYVPPKRPERRKPKTNKDQPKSTKATEPKGG